ncbi:hypothetical protein O181_101156 [Austropuccinia psidii MF-1]|uniref:BED-type domain-containing protein n=1 Tax=Austropuccinia psidii MF-1 TaxID=1389203 RepID=A0A9Q3PIE3_9BASI|nr:hypothetical protein [Austropuccinia psidii MF-1]
MVPVLLGAELLLTGSPTPPATPPTQSDSNTFCTRLTPSTTHSSLIIVTLSSRPIQIPQNKTHSLTRSDQLQTDNYLSSSIMPPEDNSSDYIDDEEDCTGNVHGDYEKYPPQPSRSHQKRQCICSSVYDYYKDMIPGGEWDEEKQALRYKYKCRHCSNKIGILGKNTSNLNKHHTCCVGCFSAWETKCPGLINPNLGTKMAAEESDTLMKDLVKALVAIQVSFSIFETNQMQSIFQRIFPGFPWPKRCQIASLASQLYYESKKAIIDKVWSLPPETMISAAIDFWTTKDQSESYMAMVIQWINPSTYMFHKKLLCFDWGAAGMEILGIINLTWPKDERFHCCACHVLNLVAKDFLAQMSQLTNEDYFFFDDYLAVHRAPIEDSEDEESPTMTELNDTIAKDNSGDLQLINGDEPNNPGAHHETYKPEPLSSANKSIFRALRDLCSHIRGSPKQRQAFIQARDKTRDPKLLPINIPMTRWNYFLLQMKHAESLRLSMQLYTATPEGSRYNCP